MSCVPSGAGSRSLAAVAALALLVACAEDSVIAPVEEQVTLCHPAASSGTTLEVPLSRLRTHTSQGD